MLTNPPEPEDYDRNLRNSCREDIIDAISNICDRLKELDAMTPKRLAWLEALFVEIRADMED